LRKIEEGPEVEVVAAVEAMPARMSNDWAATSNSCDKVVVAVWTGEEEVPSKRGCRNSHRKNLSIFIC
jgi:hypothetical protein